MRTALESSPADDPAASQTTSTATSTATSAATFPAASPLADRVRRVFIVLSARSPGYASSCISTLFDHAIETVDLTLVTDDAEDKAILGRFLGGIEPGRHSWQVVTRADATDLDWFDWLAREIGPREFAGFMHIEAIVWSAMAMRFGGAHLNPERWRCREQRLKRLFRRPGSGS